MRFDRAKLRAADEHLNNPDFHKKLRTGSGALNQAPHYDCSSGMLNKINPQPIKRNELTMIPIPKPKFSDHKVPIGQNEDEYFAEITKRQTHILRDAIDRVSFS